jgi:hypothetical protein
MSQPAQEKDNALTRFMRDVADTNAAAGLPAGRSAGGPAGIDPPTRVRTAAMKEPLIVKPLTKEEKADLDRKAQALGIMPKDELDELAEPEDDDAPAGADLVMGPMIPTPGSIRHPRTEPPYTGPGSGPNRQTAREFMNDRTRLPDFTQVQSFNLETNTIYVDGMSFPIPEEDVTAMKSYAVQIVIDHVVAQLAKALIEFGVPPTVATEAAERLRESTNDGRETVSEVRDGAATTGVPPESNQAARLVVSDVPPTGVEGLSEVGERPSEGPAS